MSRGKDISANPSMIASDVASALRKARQLSSQLAAKTNLLIPLRLNEDGKQIDERGKEPRSLIANIKAMESVNLPQSEAPNPYFEKTSKRPHKPKKFNFRRQGYFLRLAESIRGGSSQERFRMFEGLSSEASSKAQDTQLHTDTLIPSVEWWDSAFTKDYDTIDATLVSSKIITPVPIIDKKLPPPPLPLLLTADERKKMRRIRRGEDAKDKQLKIKLGLLPPEESRVKLSNMMKVLTSSAVSDPSAVEAKVKAEMRKRQLIHQLTNQKRKLTPQQLAEKRARRYQDKNSSEFYVRIYRAPDLESPQIRFKIGVNAEQFNITGVAVVTPTINAIVAEGGAKGMRKFDALMLRRIKWQGNSPCLCVWGGIIKTPAFPNFHFEVAPNETRAKEYFKDRDLPQYWDIVQNQKDASVSQPLFLEDMDEDKMDVEET